MAEKLTYEQNLAVTNRGGKLLVSAAAGSGKTKVLVDRLLSYVCDENHPANLDDFLIITYTKAAASELRGKIAGKLSERIGQDPGNRHLQRQMQRLYLTKISTVHAFCSDLLREFAFRLQIAPDFRVADENECLELRQRVMINLLDDAYANAQSNEDFRAFVDTQGLGRDDRLVPEIIFKVYDSAMCHLNPDEWLKQCVENAGASACTDASQTVWGAFLMEDLFAALDMQIRAVTRCVEQLDSADGMEKPAALMRDTLYQLQHLRGSKTWDEVVRRRDIDYGRLTFPRKNADPVLTEQVKAIRSACKKSLEKKLSSFSDESALVLEDLARSAQAVRGLICLVSDFADRYGKAKRGRRIMDFSDLEHRTLDLLLGKKRSGITAVAAEISARFREIMVDEYQDSNAVQDAIFSALTQKRQNLFMVGDVKQSIYQFRLADPGIFLEKYAAYVPAEEAEPGEGRKIMLSANFRSGGGVVESVNHVFQCCMSTEVGGLHYGEQEALREGIPHIALDEPEIELHAISVREDTYLEEAAYVASRIRTLLDGTHMVRQGDQLRPIVAEDIVILLRSPGSVGGHYKEALERCGIRCASGGGTNLLQTPEIGTLRSLLQVISNPRQDIPLIASLASPLFGFTADDLATIRANHRKGCFYDALLDDQSEKTVSFLHGLLQLREEARMCTLAELLDHIFRCTHLDSIYASMDDGELRIANLQAFYKCAVDYEKAGRRDLKQFLDYLEMMDEKGLVASDEQGSSGAVTIMSIHKSKGLEFPVVFLCGLSRSFNRESIRAQVLCHQSLGLGLSCVDQGKRIRYPAISKRAIAVKTVADSLSEEMRVLYVAMTRPKDRLIMTYASRTLESDLQQIALRMDLCESELLTSDVVCPGEWVLMAALKRAEAGELFALSGRPAEIQVSTQPWRICTAQAPELSAVEEVTDEPTVLLPGELLERMKIGLDFRYEHLPATIMPSKLTATQRKGRLKDQEAAENADVREEIPRIWRTPGFVDNQLQGKDYGSIIHSVMQYLRFEKCDSETGIREEIERLVTEGFITAEQASLVNSEKISAFFNTSIGRKLQTGGQILREFKISILEDASVYDPSLTEEQVLLQGVVDCALVEEDGITVIDFKTDRVSEQTLPALVQHYRPQIEVYAEALGRIYDLPVKEKILYFFRLDRCVSL